MDDCCHHGPTTQCECGDFTQPETCLPGRCSPYRLKLDCEAPEIPVLTEFTYTPGQIPAFTPA